MWAPLYSIQAILKSLEITTDIRQLVVSVDLGMRSHNYHLFNTFSRKW